MDLLDGPGFAPAVLAPAPPPDPVAEPAGFVVGTDDAVRIHFLDWSAGAVRDAGAAGVASTARPPASPGVLLIPGLAQTAWTWAPVARRLAASCRVVAMDLRGHGLSDAPTHGYDPDQQAEDAIAVAEGSGILALLGEPDGGPVVVAGLGYGAIIAAWTANALGERCTGLVLVDGGWEDLATVTGATAEEWLAQVEEPPEVLASMAAWLADREAFDPATWDADQERAARSQVVETAAERVKPAIHPHALRASVEAMWSYEPAAVLPSVEGRLAALVARDDDGARTAALREVASRRAATGRRPILAAAFPGRGHNLVRYEPASVASVVLAAAGAAPA